MLFQWIPANIKLCNDEQTKKKVNQVLEHINGFITSLLVLVKQNKMLYQLIQVFASLFLHAYILDSVEL
jgi:hypothetical protein